jgi:mannan endo-1,4-beta-mannosidase
LGALEKFKPSFQKKMFRSFSSLILFLLFSSYSIYPQSNNFISSKNTNFIQNEKPFFFSGTNAYYSLYLAARNDTNSLIEVFSNAKELGMKVLRIWGFYDSDNKDDPAVIQSSPGKYNENALKGLDYVLEKAAEYNFKIIISLVNNWEDYGGMNKYIEWYGKTIPSIRKNQEQKIIFRNVNDKNRSPYYRYYINGYTHDDFYSNLIIRKWYKDYVKMILTRVNTYKNIQYLNDTSIFSWELANEAESSERSGSLINSWVKEMSSFIKSIDANHLVGTGECGFDIESHHYSNTLFEYNKQDWLFNGDKGTSFYLNTLCNYIDYGSCHIYREDWNLPIESGKNWIEDHKNISTKLNKPFLLGEYGTRKDKLQAYIEWLKTIEKTNSSGALVWQLVYNSMPWNDGYFVFYSEDDEICKVISNFSSNMNNKVTALIKDQICVSQNYPNPCSRFTTFEFSIPVRTMVKINIYNILGQIVLKCEDQEYEKGNYTRGINTTGLASGVYVGKFILNQEMIIKIIQVIR